MFIPIEARGRLLGVMTLIAPASQRPFEPEILALAMELCRRVALAIDNAHLYEEAQRATQAREELLAIVSHDLRNPLSVIITNARLLEGDAARRADPDRAQKMARSILRSADSMSRLIGDLLAFAQIQAGRLSVEPRAVDVGDLIDETLEMFKPTTAEKGILLDGAVDSNLRAVGDRGRVLQVLSNLVANAIKFTPRGGHIDLRAQREQQEALFTISDSGAGIAEDDLPHIWDRFWRAAKTSASGVGLGLSIVKALVEAQGGRIWAESKIGSGTTFHFTLPLAEGEQGPTPVPRRSEGGGAEDALKSST
jgi:signal transduction histidine kinase